MLFHSVIEKAVVPIIKLIDNQTLVHIDISFNTSNGKEAASLVKVTRNIEKLRCR